VTWYPAVADEWATVRKLLEGYSVARLGDGEFKLADGQGYSREPGCKAMARELRQILRQPAITCLPAIPTMDPEGPKGGNWQRHRERYAQLLHRGVAYYSAFITRPDSAPSINCQEYADLIGQLWRGRRVAVVSEPTNKILSVVGIVADELIHIPCPNREAYAQIDELIRHALSVRAELVLVSCGPTATCMANRMSDKVQTIDIGSAGGFLHKLAVSR
jgi:glycosyltransferase GT-like protein